jgi:hypothetical protein
MPHRVCAPHRHDKDVSVLVRTSGRIGRSVTAVCVCCQAFCPCRASRGTFGPPSPCPPLSLFRQGGRTCGPAPAAGRSRPTALRVPPSTARGGATPGPGGGGATDTPGSPTRSRVARSAASPDCGVGQWRGGAPPPRHHRPRHWLDTTPGHGRRHRPRSDAVPPSATPVMLQKLIGGKDDLDKPLLCC